MPALFTRASLSRGPGYMTIGGATLFPISDMDPRHSPEFNPVKLSLHGQIDKYKTDFVIKHRISVFGLFSSLPVLFPSYILNPTIGASIFTNADQTLVYQARNNDRITYFNSQITKLLDLHLGVDSETFSAALEITSIIANGANPEDASAYFVRDTNVYAAPTFDMTQFVKSRWTGSWNGKAGLTAFVGQNGFNISWTFDAKPCVVKGWGTVDMTVGEGGLIGMCKCIPIVPTAAQIDAAQGLGGGTTGAPLAGDAHGTLLSSLGADLTLTAGAHSVVLKGAGITESGSVFGIEPLRNGELAFETTRGFAANVPNATAAIS